MLEMWVDGCHMLYLHMGDAECWTHQSPGQFLSVEAGISKQQQANVSPSGRSGLSVICRLIPAMAGN